MKNFFQLVLAGAFLTVTSSPAQINDSGMHGFMKITTKQSSVLNDVKGSPYLYEDFKSGMVTLDGKDPIAALLRYDVNTETFEIKTANNSEDIYVLPVSEKTVYHLGTETYVYRNINAEGIKKGYFKVLYEGDRVSLLEKPTLTFIEPVKAKTGYEKDKPGQLLLEQEFYLVLEDGKGKNVRLKEKDFEKALASKPVEKYLSDNKLKSVEDYVKMLEWYDNQVE